ncbi:MAG: response regulator [Candidatus Pacebacteria bacterium]|nr:response regulator [Candidatus Paceibacterota bacterium]
MKKVLIIEDDDFLQGLEAKKLTKEGYDVLTASNSVEAFEKIETNRDINIILLDLLLPDVDGFTILAKIREENKIPNVPIIVFSNLAEDKDIAKANKLGVNDFMVKSNFTLDELVAKLKSLIG